MESGGMVGMNFEQHFSKQDVPKARKEFQALTGCLTLIQQQTSDGEIGEAKHTAIDLLNALSKLDTMAYQHRASQRMYLHHLLNQATGWYPR